ncbi:MAG: cysteine--tRNA ligase [Spirochaetaceae bacterium]|nr:cysteine--tRNA ligase [Spirochaetaceae bacterium]
MLKLYNSLTRKVQDFKPITKNEALLYCCGPTVYAYAHIGNLRTYIFEDLLRRTLQLAGYNVNHVMNITDVGHLTSDGDEGEDKMIKAAREQGMDVWDIARFFTAAFFKDCEALNILKPTAVCLATDHITEMIDTIKLIEQRGYTYQAGGNLYFDSSKDKKYGILRGYGLSSDTVSRVAADGNKRNNEDFVLWFTSSKFERQAMLWDSPWGRGYPGWHIECSAMSHKYLGKQFDIHCGGVDHIGVHHTNEIAQSLAAYGKEPAKFWLHGEFLVLNSDKMSKSSGSFLTLSALLEQGFKALDYRYFCLIANYRKKLNFSTEALKAAKTARAKLVGQAARLALLSADSNITAKAAALIKEFNDKLLNDLSSVEAIALVHTALKDDKLSDISKAQLLKHCDDILALGLFAEAARETAEPEALPEHLLALIEERKQAKLAKDFALADNLRAKLLVEGIILEDKGAETTWRLK